MATRCTIKVEGVDYAKVYKHWDGYPEATLKFLEDFNKSFTEERGNDPTYKFAQLLRHSSVYAEKYNIDASLFTGWGVYPYGADCGEEYEYLLNGDGTVEYHDTYDD